MLQFALRQTLATLLAITPALAASPAEQRGKTFALTNCARCHSIDWVSQSPLKIAPPFRTLHNRYPVETLAEGIQTGHPTMPEFQIDPDQIHRPCRKQITARMVMPFDPSQRRGATTRACWVSFSHVRERAMAARTKTYPIVENAFNLFGDWLKHRQEMRELRDMKSGDFARIAQDLCVSSTPSSARDHTPATSCRDC
jgi:cytochrome c